MKSFSNPVETTPDTPVTDLIELLQFDLPEKIRKLHDHAVHFGAAYWDQDVADACYFVSELAGILKRLDEQVHPGVIC